MKSIADRDFHLIIAKSGKDKHLIWDKTHSFFPFLSTFSQIHLSLAVFAGADHDTVHRFFRSDIFILLCVSG